LSLGLTGSVAATSLHAAADAPVFELKGVIESLLSLFASGEVAFTADAPGWLQAGRSATALLNGEPVAQFGELAVAEKERRKLRQPVYLAQIDLAKLYTLPLRQVTAREISRFQAVERDFSFTFPDSMQWQTIAATIRALGIPELQKLAPTEIFRDAKGKSVPPGYYAILLKCVFQSNERTLREDELTTWWSDIIAALTKLGGTIRAPGL
jgi:phenylalanyl-tRNA synthetase beta chain